MIVAVREVVVVKRAFSTLACMDKTWKEAVDAAVRADLQALEIRLYEDGSIFGLRQEELNEFVSYLQKCGIGISDLGTSVVLFGYEPEKIEQAKAAIRLAEQVKAGGIRVFVANSGKRVSDLVVYDYDGIVKALKELCQYAFDHSVEVWVETHGEFSTGKSVAEILQDVDCSNLKVIWDILHSIERREEPKDTMRYLGDKIVHVHIKDGRKASDAGILDFVHTKLGEGEVPIRKILMLLEEAGYDGYFSLEWENAWRAELRGYYHEIDDLLRDFNAYLDNAVKTGQRFITEDDFAEVRV